MLSAGLRRVGEDAPVTTAACPRPGTTDWLRPLGSTGLRVTAVTAGTSPLGSMPALYGHDVSEDDGVATALAVLASPIRVLDTSNGYGDGASERRIGAAIAHLGGLPDDALVATKVDARGRDYSGARVRASLAESRDRLGLERLPLVHLHDPEFHPFEEITAPGGAVDTLVALRDAGEIGALGLAGGDVHEMLRYLRLGVFQVLLTHNRSTLVDRSADALLAEAAERGVAVLNAAVYGGGLLAGRGGGPGAAGRTATYGYRPAPREVLDAVAAMRRVCAERGTDLATAALQHSLRDTRFASTVVGMGRPARVEQTLDAARAELPQELFDELESLLPPARVWLDARP